MPEVLVLDGAYADDMIQAWGRTQAAARQCLASGEPQLLSDMQDMSSIWPQFGHEDQADAADFLQAVWAYSRSTFFAGWFFHRSERGHTEEREQFPFNILFPESQGPTTLDTLINLWADEGRGQFLYGSPGGLVLNLQRSALLEGTWTKHHSELTIQTNVHIPFSEDGENVHYATYQVVGLVLHQGATHENGHYQAILALNNVYWLADDNVYPVPLAKLTPQQQAEISQVWLTLAPTDAMVTDTAMELTGTEAKRLR